MKLNIPNYFKFDTVQIKKSLLEILKTKVPTITLDENEFNGKYLIIFLLLLIFNTI